MTIEIRHHITHLQQANPDDCWATAIAMVMGRHSSAGVDHVKNLAQSQGIVPNPDGSMPPENVSRVARAVHLACHDFRSGRRMTLDLLQSLMEPSAIAVFGGVNYPSQRTSLDHVLALYQLVGDGRPRHTMVYFIDPFDGRSFHDNFERFEGEMVVPDFILARR
jgi:hypothetical protein